jgi:hypothetical protein
VQQRVRREKEKRRGKSQGVGKIYVLMRTGKKEKNLWEG